MNKIPVCRPTLPKLSDYVTGLEEIWQSRMLSNFGKYADQFESIVSEYLGTKLVKIVGNADIGLTLAVAAFGFEEDSEVILPSFTFNSTANCVVWNKLKPVFADIDKNDFCLDPVDVEKRITSKTKLIIATQVFGNPCKVEELRQLADKYNLKLMFDSAQAYGSIYKGKKIGLFGDIEVFSFSGTKVVTSAEGGIVVTNNPDLLDKVNFGRNFGFLSDYNSTQIGSNGKISEFNALLGCLTLPSIEEELVTRFKVVDKYTKDLTGVGDIRFQKICDGNRSVYKDMAILTCRRDELADYLQTADIQTKKYFFPIHHMDFYRSGLVLPVTEEIAKTCLCIPLYNEMTAEEQDYVINSIKNFYAKN